MGSGITQDATGRAGQYQDPRTGLWFENKSIAIALGYGQDYVAPIITPSNIAIPQSESSPGGMDTRLRDQFGNLITNQVGSQYWMTKAFDIDLRAGLVTEPTLAEKAVASDAVYANNQLVQYLTEGYFTDPTSQSGYVRPPAVAPASGSTTGMQASPTGTGGQIANQAITDVISPASAAESRTPEQATTAGGYIVYIVLAIIIAVGLLIIGVIKK